MLEIVTIAKRKKRPHPIKTCHKVDMELQYFLLLLRFYTGAVDVQVDGEVRFDLIVSNNSSKKHSPNHVFRANNEKYNDFGKYLKANEDTWKFLEPKINRSQFVKNNYYLKHNSGENLKSAEPKSGKAMKKVMVTVAPIVECTYQYPENEQIDNILSNMMNGLTKVFVRAQELVTPDKEFRRKHETRFHIVYKKNSNFFESIYYNMTGDYKKFFNRTSNRKDRSGQLSDPCKHQEEIKQLWKDLLDTSVVTFRRAAVQCLEEHLKFQNRSADVKARNRLRQFLATELSKVKSNQLDILCDSFQLCFHELLEKY